MNRKRRKIREFVKIEDALKTEKKERKGNQKKKKQKKLTNKHDKHFILIHQPPPCRGLTFPLSAYADDSDTRQQKEDVCDEEQL